MKKTILLTKILLAAFTASRAQGIGSIFTQQESKDKLMLQQIALQQTYLSAIKKGYRITESGLNTVHDLKNGTFNLHKDYFNSLDEVSPTVKNNPKIALITDYQHQIMTSFENEISWQRQQSILGADEISYIERIYNHILSECKLDLEELDIVVTPGKAQMKDAERIKKIDGLYSATSEKYQFSISFTHLARSFALDRQNGKLQDQVIKKLYDIN